MKKMMPIVWFCLLCLALSPLMGVAEGAPLSIVCTTFPQYDWTRAILGETVSDVHLTLLMDQGVDLHNYQPTARDIALVSACDLFIHVGGASDAWVEGALGAAQNPRMAAISLMDGVEIKMENHEHDEHDEHEEHEEHEEHDEEEHEHEEHAHADEHVWLSLRNAQALTNQICDALCTLKPENEAQYRANAAAYVEKIVALDARYQAMVDAAARRTILFADRFPFRYLAEDYQLEPYAAFSGCSAESEASFETIAFLVGKVDEEGLPAVLVLEGANQAIARTVIAGTRAKDQAILTMNSLQSVTAADIANGASYLDIMEDNLVALEQALN